jgi:TRAP-type C4-dicarboxylate transport system substrate-binding protein
MKKIFATAAAFALCASMAKAEPTMLRFALLAPPTTWVYTMAGDQWSKEVMAASAGTLDIKFFFGTQLGTVRNIYDRTVQGAVEDCYEAATALWQLYKTGVIADEFEKVKPLVLFTFPGYVISTTKPVKTLADMDGLKLITTARLTSQGVQLLGGVPVTLIPTEIYSAIQRGTAAGTIISWAAISVFKIEELTKYDVDTPFGHGPTYYFMNKEAYAKLPQAAQRAIDRYSYDPLNKRLALAGAKVQDEAAAYLTSKGHVVSEFDPSVAAQFKQRVAPITEEWVRDTPDGAKVLAAYRAEILKARAAPR